MRRLFVLVVVALSLVVGGVLPSAAGPQRVTLLHVNDTHSHMDGWGPKDGNLDGTLGGLPKVATIVAEERTADPAALFVHAGDFMNGDLFFNEYLGAAELQVLEFIGLDALVLGNHEFEFGPSFLKNVLNGAWPGGTGAVPVLGTNLDLTLYPKLTSWVVKTLVKDVNGVTIGLFGLTTPNGALARPDPVVIDADLAGVATAAVSGLRVAGAQVIVCVSHVGLDVAEPLAQAVGGIDVIVNGHDHAVLSQPEQVARPGGGKTYIVSAGSYYRWVGRLQLSVDGDQVTFVDYTLRSVDASVEPDPAVQAAIAELKAGIVARYGDVYHTAIGWAEDDIAPASDPDKAKRDTPLGNLLADAYRAWTGTDVAFEATAFLGQEIPAGPIVGADLFRAMTYGLPLASPAIVQPYSLVTFEMTGADLIAAIEKTLAMGPDYFPQVSGMRLHYDSTLPARHRILADSVHIGGQKLQATGIYTVTVTQGVQMAFSSMRVPMTNAVTLPDLAFNATRALVAARGTIGAAASNRLRDVAMIPGQGKQ